MGGRDTGLRCGEDLDSLENVECLTVLTEHLDHVVYVFDIATERFLHVSPAYERVWERPVQELLDDPDKLVEAIHPDDIPAFREAARVETEEGRDFDLVYRIVTPDGRVKWIRTRSFKVYDAEGAPYRRVGISEDVTAWKETVRALEESEKHLNLAQEVAGIGSWKLDVETGQLYWSDELLRIHGLDPTKHRVDLASAMATLHPEERARVESEFQQNLKRGRSYRLVHRIVRTDGEVRVVETIGRVELGADGKPVTVYGTGQDVTERQHLELQVAQADRLSSMGVLAAGVAHEINNPLAYVLYNLESLSNDLRDVLGAARGALDDAEPSAVDVRARTLDLALTQEKIDDILDRLDDALSGTRRIQEIARGLWAFSRVDEGQKSSVDLARVLDRTAKMASNEIKYRATLVRQLDEVPPIAASEGRLSQVFLNLLINATQAIEEGDAEHNEIRIRTWVEDEHVCAEVSDTGSGIASEHQRRIFDPFFTTKEVGAGSGLGLSISKKIVEEHGGTIEVRSEAGEGTSFIVRLPITATPVEEDRATPKGATASPARRGRVLAVDDEVGIRRTLRRILREHDVVLAASGEEAREILEKDRGFDVIICDMMMPRSSGMDLHQWLMELDHQLADRVVFITGGAFTPHAREYLAEVQNPRVEKPFDAKELKQLIGEVIEQSLASGLPEECASLER